MCYFDQTSLPFTFLQMSLVLPAVALAPDFIQAAPTFVKVFDPLVIAPTVELVSILSVARASV
jgi:hypothetical protein